MATVRWRTLLGLVSVAASLSAVPAVANDSAAHSIADRFAHDNDSAPPSSIDKDRQALERKLDAEARLKADEAEMLERAKSEAADQQRAADSARLAAEKRIADETQARDRTEKEAAEKVTREAEQHRLAEEKAEADRRAADEAARLAEEKRKAEQDLAEDKAARERAAREAARIKDAEKQRLAAEKAEADRLASAKVEAERLAAEKAEANRLAAEKAEADRLAAAKAEEARRASENAAAERREIEAAKARIETARQADAQRQQDADAQRRMEAEREDEARRLSEKLARAREQRAAKDLGEGYSALGNPPQPEGGSGPDAGQGPTASSSAPLAAGKSGTSVALASEGETRATILLVMEPGTRGIRRYEKTADPIICIGEECFVGNGVEQAATPMTRGRAFGPGNTLGQRAGACRHSLACVFRDVPVGSGRFEVQPIDLRILRHDRREKITVEADRTCTAVGGYLRCSKGSTSASYRLWVVPESVARKAGASALGAAVSGGLPEATAAELRR